MGKDQAHQTQVYMIKNRTVHLHKEFLEADCKLTTLKKEKTNWRILVGRGQKGDVIIEKQNSIILFHSRLSLAVYRQNRTEYRSEENK